MSFQKTKWVLNDHGRKKVLDFFNTKTNYKKSYFEMIKIAEARYNHPMNSGDQYLTAAGTDGYMAYLKLESGFFTQIF